MSTKQYQTCTFLVQLSSFRHDANEPRYILSKTYKVNIFDVESVLKSNFKRFGKNAIRENFNLKRHYQMKKTHSNLRCNYLYQHKDTETKLH